MVLFGLGLLIVLTKKSTIMMLIGLELMLNSANLNLMAFSSFRADANGQLLMIFILIVAVCEAAVGLAIALRVYRYYHTSVPEKISSTLPLSSRPASSVTGKVMKVCLNAGNPLPKIEISSQTRASSATTMADRP